MHTTCFSAHQIQYYLLSLLAINPSFPNSFFYMYVYNVTPLKKLCLRGKALSCCLEPFWLIITAVMRLKYCQYDVKPSTFNQSIVCIYSYCLLIVHDSRRSFLKNALITNVHWIIFCTRHSPVFEMCTCCFDIRFISKISILKLIKDLRCLCIP